MAPRAISAAVIEAVAGVCLAAAVAVADQPDPNGAAVQAKEAVRSQVQVQEPNGFGEPWVAAGQEVGPQSQRQLGPGEGSGNQFGSPANGSAKGSAARAQKGAKPDASASRRGANGSKTSAKRSKGSPAATLQQQRLRDPSSGCSGTPTMTRSNASSGQHRGGGRR